MDLKTVMNEDDSRPTEDLKVLSDRRLASLAANPDDVTTWDAIKDYVRRPRSWNQNKLG